VKHLYRIAFALALITILCSSVEALVSTYFGYEDESLTLFGFGADSLIEVVSGFGIAHMILRIQRHPESKRNDFERTALQITGYAFLRISNWTCYFKHLQFVDRSQTKYDNCGDCHCCAINGSHVGSNSQKNKSRPTTKFRRDTRGRGMHKSLHLYVACIARRKWDL